MMKATLIPLVLILAGCDPTPPPHPETERTPSPAFATQAQALEKARADNIDILLIDTAGRLQNKAALMDELEKINRVIKKLDATAFRHPTIVAPLE